MKKVFSLILVGVLAVGLTTGCGKKENENDDNKIIEQPNISNSKVKGLDVVDFITTTEDNITTIFYSVENNTDAAISYNKIECEMYDKDKNMIYSFSSELGTIEPGEYKNIVMNVAVSSDLSELTTVKYNVE